MLELADCRSSVDLSSLLTNALKMRCDNEYLSQFASLSSTASSLEMSPPLVSPGEGRKRRRGELSNAANTLDGLVARRTVDGHEPFQKRYLSEQEAIEGPDDEEEMKRMEKDPDVSTRTCSTCGYQGKWVSEMIRHKRVHTNERPFKCRYCSRTSKWKADLIRHVAKTHGIRVVSKYSRSKTFDSNSLNLSKRLDEDKPRVFACEADKEPPRQKMAVEEMSPSGEVISRSCSYRCAQCLYEQDGLSVLIKHLRAVHGMAPYECHCGMTFDSVDVALGHVQTSATCTSSNLIVHVSPVYKSKGKQSVSLASSPSSRSDVSSDSGVQTDLEEYDDFKCCDSCPFKTTSELDLRQHLEGHLPPKGLLNYKCVFCSWYAKKKTAVEEHMRVHTHSPHLYMSEVEKNLITPVSLDASSNLLAFGGQHQQPEPNFPILSTSALELTSALIALQNQMAPSYLAALLRANLMATPSAFTPVAALTGIPAPSSTTTESKDEVVDVEM